MRSFRARDGTMGLSNIEDVYPRFNTFSASRYAFFRFGIAALFTAIPNLKLV